MNLCNKILFAPCVQLYSFLFKQVSRRTTKMIVIHYVSNKTMQIMRLKIVKNIFSRFSKTFIISTQLIKAV